MFDFSNSQIVISTMALILGGLFVCMARFPRNTGIKSNKELEEQVKKTDQAWEEINLKEEEKIHLDNIEVNDESVKKYLEEVDKTIGDMKKDFEK
jgi:hypothetical protein